MSESSSNHKRELTDGEKAALERTRGALTRYDDGIENLFGVLDNAPFHTDHLLDEQITLGLVRGDHNKVESTGGAGNAMTTSDGRVVRKPLRDTQNWALGFGGVNSVSWAPPPPGTPPPTWDAQKTKYQNDRKKIRWLVFGTHPTLSLEAFTTAKDNVFKQNNYELEMMGVLGISYKCHVMPNLCRDSDPVAELMGTFDKPNDDFYFDAVAERVQMI